MRASWQERVGTTGISDVKGNLQRIGWGPIDNHEHDLGTDLFVQVRDERQFDIGTIVGIQVKSGARWFRQEKRANKQVVGWWFYEENARHFDYWTEHSLVHLVVLNDEEAKVSYWAHVTPSAMVPTGRGVRVLIPKSQKIDESNLQDLLSIARHSQVLDNQGTIWSAAASNLGIGQRLRYALLTPRLVAPHRNQGLEMDLAPEEALALIVSGRFADYSQISKTRPGTPTPEDAAAHEWWRWRLVGAAWNAIFGEPGALEALLALRAEADRRSTDFAAATALAVACLVEAERYGDALELAVKTLEGDTLEPVDQAWIASHAINLELDAGTAEQAKSLAAQLLLTIPTGHRDVTYSAFKAVAAWGVFARSGPGSDAGPLATMLTAADNTTSWWRQQIASYGLADALTTSFRDTLLDRTNRWTAEDVANSRLWSAGTISALAGDYPAHRAHRRQLGMHDLVAALKRSKPDQVTEALRDLRRAQDRDGLKIGINFLKSEGPASALRPLVDETAPHIWTHLASHAVLDLWERAGDYMSTDASDAAVADCLTAIEDPDSIERSIEPTFFVLVECIDALSGLVYSSSDASRQKMVDLLADLPNVGDPLLSQALAHLAITIEAYEPRPSLNLEVKNPATGQADPRLRAALHRLFGTPDSAALAAAASVGDDDALGAFNDIRDLDQSAAKKVIARHAGFAKRTVESATRGAFSRGGHDSGDMLGLLNIHFPAVAQWEPLLSMLTHPLVAAADKHNGAMRLAKQWDDLPQEIRDRVSEMATELARPAQGGSGLLRGESDESATALLAARSGGLDDAQLAALIGRLSSATDQRGLLPLLFKMMDVASNGVVWLLLLAHSDPSVRSGAAACLTVAACGDKSDPYVEEGAARACNDPSRRVPLAVATNLPPRELDASDGSLTAGRLREKLSVNPSAVVRRLAEL